MREQFRSWYLRSARSDGASVSSSRRVLNILVSCVVLLAWYVWMAKAHPFVPNTFRKLAVEHPLCAGGLVLAFILMNFRATTLDYMAYSVYRVANVQLRRSIFSSERKLRQKYEELFGRDSFYKMPEFVGASSVLVMIVSGFALVFSR
jgi:hypothetical protein